MFYVQIRVNIQSRIFLFAKLFLSSFQLTESKSAETLLQAWYIKAGGRRWIDRVKLIPASGLERLVHKKDAPEYNSIACKATDQCKER